jgi:hypothetical protein
VKAGPLRFAKAPPHQDGLDLGIGPDGRVLLAYKAELPQRHPGALKVHARWRDGNTWTRPQTVDGPWEVPPEDFYVVWTDRRAMVTWLSREKTTRGGVVLVHGVRRVSVTDGKSWSTPRPLATSGGGLPSLGRRRVPVGPLSLSTYVASRGTCMRPGAARKRSTV